MMLHSTKLSYKFWAEAINTSVYKRNQCITQSLQEKSSPEEAWSGYKPSIAHMRIFGCEAFALINTHRHKFESKSEPCIFIGYSMHLKAYHLWSTTRNKLIISRNVQFNKGSID